MLQKSGINPNSFTVLINTAIVYKHFDNVCAENYS